MEKINKRIECVESLLNKLIVKRNALLVFEKQKKSGIVKLCKQPNCKNAVEDTDYLQQTEWLL